MKKTTFLAALATVVLLVSGCAGDAALRADAARIKAMGVSLQTHSKNLSKSGDATSCTVSHKKSGWLAAIVSDEEEFTTTCEKDPYETDELEYEGNVSPDNPWAPQG